MSTKNRRRTTTRNIRFPNQMIEQINIALEQKGPGISQPESFEACRRRLAEKRAYTSIKSDEEWTSRILREQDDIVIHSAGGICSSWVCSFTTFLTVTDCVLAHLQTNSLNDYCDYGDQSTTRE